MTNFVDEQLDGDPRYNISENDGTPFKSNMRIDLATAVLQAGTALTAAILNELFQRNLQYKITPTVASNNLTVALKRLDGSNASATAPIYVKIGDTWRSITGALSVTKNAGTNWCNAGGAELATLESDYFVYLGYNATDGVVIGFSRIPFANKYADFSTTAANEQYCAISNIAHAAAGDDYVIIGRFAATLSAGAGYTWSVPAYTGANLIQRPIRETRWLNWTPTLVGFSANPTGTDYRYKVTDDLIFVISQQGTNGTSNATNFTETLPMGCYDTATVQAVWTTAVDNNAVLTAAGRAVLQTSGGNLMTLYKDMASTAWTGSSGKRACVQLFYPLR